MKEYPASRITNPVSDLPEDVVLSVRNVSKKFCRNLRRSMWYGIQDLSKNLMGKTADYRPQTADSLAMDLDSAPSGGSQGLQSAVCGLQSSPKGLQSAVCGLQSNSDGLRPAEFWALRDISFDLRRGECLGLIGRNGCGKTTLLRLIAGIFPPDGGEIAIRGRGAGSKAESRNWESRNQMQNFCFLFSTFCFT